MHNIIKIGFLPLVKSLLTISSRSLLSAASNVMNVPRPLVEFIKAGNSASNSLSPDISTSPDFSTTDNKFSLLITFNIASSNMILVGSPIQVLNTRYGMSGLQKVDRYLTKIDWLTLLQTIMILIIYYYKNSLFK